MPLAFVESFDHFNTAQATEKWVDFGIASVSAGNGRKGTAAAANLSGGTNIYQGINTPADARWLLVGAAYWHDPANSNDILIWRDYNGDILGFVVADLSGSFSVWRGLNTVLGTRIGTTRARLWHQQEWFYLEARIHLEESPDGAAYLYVNGQEELAATGIDMFPSAGGGYTPEQPWRSVGFFTKGYLDDIYVAYEGGLVDASDVSTVGTNLGDIHVENRMAVPDATAAGTYQDFTPSSGSDHGAMVDENLPGNDADTTYNASPTPEAIDTYRYEAIAAITSGNIWGVQFNPTVRKEGIGTRIMRNLIRVSGSNFGGRPFGLPADYIDYWETREANPTTGIAWTIAEVDALEWGINLQVATDNALPDEGGPAPGSGQPPPDGAPPGPDVTGAPASATFLPIIQAYAAANPSQLANSCLATGGTWDFMDGVLADLRAVDSRWGYCGQRGNVNDVSEDAFCYYSGPGDPYTGALETYVFDIIVGHCGGSPTVAFNDVTRPNVLAAWLQSRT